MSIKKIKFNIKTYVDPNFRYFEIYADNKLIGKTVSRFYTLFDCEIMVKAYFCNRPPIIDKFEFVDMNEK